MHGRGLLLAVRVFAVQGLQVLAVAYSCPVPSQRRSTQSSMCAAAA